MSVLIGILIVMIVAAAIGFLVGGFDGAAWGVVAVPAIPLSIMLALWLAFRVSGKQARTTRPRNKGGDPLPKKCVACGGLNPSEVSWCKACGAYLGDHSNSRG